VVTEEALDTGHAVQVAERLEENNPDWVIMYGSYSREFVAFPVYPDAPDNSYCSAKDPSALGDHIRETERRHGRIRLRRRAADGRQTAGGLSYPEIPDFTATVNSLATLIHAGDGHSSIFRSVTAGPGQSSFLG
jgi:hypothetical protein